MKWTDPLLRGVGPGALAGLVGGLVFGLAMTQLGYLPTIASLVRTDSPPVGFVVHLAIAAFIGGVFGALVARQRLGAGEILWWGLAYGAFWWFLGPLTLLPLLLGNTLAWDASVAQAAFPSLVGHLWYGASTALALVALRRGLGEGRQVDDSQERGDRFSVGAAVRGALAGLLAAWLLGVLLDAQGLVTLIAPALFLTFPLGAWLLIWLVGLLGGISFALLYPHPAQGSGPMLVRGVGFGFVLWVAGSLTLFPLISGQGLLWSAQFARAVFAMLPGFLLFGAGLALFYCWLDGLVRQLFSDGVRVRDQDGGGTEALRALGRGALGGLVGGLVFTLLMLQVGFLGTVATLVGGVSLTSGLLVHLAISLLIGASYGVLFHRHSFDNGSAIGWGVSYGLFWWVLGSLTLLPMLLGAPPRWTAEVAAALLPSLVGHLAYGAGLGVVFHYFEARHAPWWVPRTRLAETRVANRREQLLTSAPALWVLVVVIGLTLPVVLAGGAVEGDGYGYGDTGGGYGENGESGGGYGDTQSGGSDGYGEP